MAPREQLQLLLETFCEHVYFQPPATVQMEYPAIVYERDTINTRFADNAPYWHAERYSLKVICKSPDDILVKQIAGLPMCTHDRFFVVLNLNHDVFTMYF